jgi:hypothetical protein
MDDVPRMIDMPEDSAREHKDLRRMHVFLAKMRGESVEQIYREVIDLAIQAAREGGCDESDVEVMAAQARRDVADILENAADASVWRPILKKAIELGFLKHKDDILEGEEWKQG